MKGFRNTATSISALALSTTLLLAGCSGTTGQQGATNDQEQQAASTTSAADAEKALSGGGVDTGDQPQLTNEDVAGNYLLESNVDSDAIFSMYQFSKDGKFAMVVTAGDSEMKREGKYEIKDGDIYVNVSEGESFELQGTKYTAKEIKDAKFTLDGDKLTTNDIGSDKQTLHKISDEELKQLKEKAAAAGPKRIKVGETVSGDGYTFTVNSLEFQDEVYPSDTSGYYRYWTHEDDHDYLVAEVTYVNDGTDYQVPGRATAALLSVGENNYNASIEVDDGSMTSSNYSIDPKETKRVIILASVPDAAREGLVDVKLTWEFPKEASKLNYTFTKENNIRYTLVR